MAQEEGLSEQAQIELEIIVSNLDQSIADIGKFNAETGYAVKTGKDLETGLVNLRNRFNDSGSAAVTNAGKVQQYAAGFQELVTLLQTFNEEQRTAAQSAVVGGSLDGLNRSTIQGMSTEDLQKLRAINDAATNSGIAGVNKELSVREGAAAAETKAVEQVMQAKLKANADAYADAQRVAEAELKIIQTQTDAWVKSYSDQAAAAQKADEAIAAAQQSNRYATVPNASRNSANPLAAQAAQTEYANQELAQYNAQLRAAETENTKFGGSTTSAAYSLFNIGFQLGIVGAALEGADVLAIKTANDFEQSFANVTRTVGLTKDEGAALETQLIALSEVIPVSFDDLTKIAAAGGQLGVQASDIADFTKTVAEFSATTNISVDDAATALGRLGQLLPGVQGNYAGLASAILKVGVTSVATESEIVNISTQIAGVATEAGLSTTDVIGLAGAMASLGIPAEQSRGVVTQVFNDISKAVATPGAALTNFAKVSGETSQQFADQWGGKGGGPRAAILALLNGINSSGEPAVNTLNGLGITSIRAVSSLEKLAQNTDVLTKAWGNADGAIGDGSELTRQFGVITETTSAKLKILGDTWQAFLDAIGKSASGPVASLADIITAVLKALTDIANNPVGQWIAGLSLAVTALLGVMVSLIAVTAGAAGSYLLFTSALQSTALSEEAVAVATNVMKVALVSTGIGAAVVLLGTLVAALLEASGAFDTAADKANAYFGSFDAITSGLQSDQEVYQKTGAAISQISTSQGTATVAADSWVEGLQKATGAQVALNDNTSNTTSAIESQTVAYGSNAKAALAAALANSSQYQALFKDGNPFQNSLVTGAGGSAKGLTEAILGDPEKGGQEYVDKLDAAIQKEITKKTGGAQNVNASATAKNILGPLQDAVTASKDAVTAGAASVTAFGVASESAADKTGDLSASITDASGQTETLSSELQNQINSIFATSNAQAKLATDTDALGTAFAQNGAQVASSGSEMQAVIADILATSLTQGEAADRMQGFFNALVGGGKASASQLALLQAVIDQLGGSTSAVSFDLSGFTQAQKQAQTQVEKTSQAAQVQVRTLVDYANDITSTLQRAEDIRFGPQDGLDAISSGWQAIATSTTQANDDIAQYKAQLLSLTADKSAKEYFLSVANAFGDTLRAAQLKGDIAGDQNQIKDSTEKLASAQTAASKSTDGNTASAIANRTALQGMVDDYNNEIAAAAASGLSQQALGTLTQKLKQDFIDQATQLGYSKQSIEEYTTSFGDMSTIIAKVPRNITVTANTNPALQALDELQAKLTKLAGTNYSPTITPKYNDGPAAESKKKTDEALWSQFVNAQGIPQGSNIPNWIKQKKAQFLSIYGPSFSDGFYDGGYTGDGPTGAVAGSVHGQEFVFSAAATRNIGVANLAFAHNMAKQGNDFSAAFGSLAQQRGSSAPTYTQLAPFDRQLLVDIRQAVENSQISPSALAAIGQAQTTNSAHRRAS